MTSKELRTKETIGGMYCPNKNAMEEKASSWKLIYLLPDVFMVVESVERGRLFTKVPFTLKDHVKTKKQTKHAFFATKR